MAVVVVAMRRPVMLPVIVPVLRQIREEPAARLRWCVRACLMMSMHGFQSAVLLWRCDVHQLRRRGGVHPYHGARQLT